MTFDVLVASLQAHGQNNEAYLGIFLAGFVDLFFYSADLWPVKLEVVHLNFDSELRGCAFDGFLQFSNVCVLAVDYRAGDVVLAIVDRLRKQIEEWLLALLHRIIVTELESRRRNQFRLDLFKTKLNLKP